MREILLFNSKIFQPKIVLKYVLINKREYVSFYIHCILYLSVSSIWPDENLDEGPPGVERGEELESENDAEGNGVNVFVVVAREVKVKRAEQDTVAVIVKVGEDIVDSSMMRRFAFINALLTSSCTILLIIDSINSIHHLKK